AFEEGGSDLKPSSTGCVEAHQPESRNRKGGPVWPFGSNVAAEAAGRARAARIRGGLTSCTTENAIGCPSTISRSREAPRHPSLRSKKPRRSGNRSSSRRSRRAKLPVCLLRGKPAPA